jgi:hypothetical protein
MMRLGKDAAVRIERVVSGAFAESYQPSCLAWLYLHPSNQLLRMIGVHPVGSSVVVNLDVAGRPTDLGLKVILAGR